MDIRYIVGALLVSIFVAGGPPLPASNTHSTLGALIAPTAEAKNLREKARSLLDRVLGESMPEGIVKTNGRIEAIQVDVAAKYPGRLVDITVEEGSEVKAGQVVGRVSSPEYEAQLRAAQSNLDKAKQALAEAGIAHRSAQCRLGRCQIRFRTRGATCREANYHATDLRSAPP